MADPLDPKVEGEAMVLGPVISAKSKKFILEMIEIGIGTNNFRFRFRIIVTGNKQKGKENGKYK